MKKIFIIILAIVLMTTTTSCWNKRELNELAIVLGVGIDPGENEGEYKFVYQVVNPSAFSGGGGIGASMTPTLIISSEGPTVFESVRKASILTSRRLYFGHLQCLIINSSIAEDDGIKNFLDLFYRDHEIRENIYTIIAKDIDTKTILSSQSVLEKNAGVLIYKKIENAYKNSSYSHPVELRKLVSTLMNKNAGAIIPTINIFPPVEKESLDDTKVSVSPSVLKSTGLAIFKKDKLIGYLNNEETRSFNWITDNMKKGVLVIEDKGPNSIEIISSKTDISSRISNGKPVIELSIKMEGTLGELNSSVDISKLEEVKKFETKINKLVNSEVKQVIDKAQNEFKSDFLQFNEQIFKHHPKEWKKYEKNWDEIFEKLRVEVKVNTVIRHLGTKNKSYQSIMEGK